MKLTIKVTKDTYRKSMWCGTDKTSGPTAENCAIALAVRDIFPEAMIGNQAILPFGYSTLPVEYIELPQAAAVFIRKFDSMYTQPSGRLDLPELEFTVDIPDKVIEQINIDEIKPLLENHPTLSLA